MILRLAIIASLGGLLFGYETGVAAGALRAANQSWGLGGEAFVLLSSATLLGALFGALAGGRLGDMVGRRDVIMATAALFTLGAFSSAIAPSIYVLVIARIVVGIAVGAISVAVPLYLAEIAPARSRGALVTGFQLAITLGILAAYLINQVFGSEAESDPWRMQLGLGALPGILLGVTALLLKESPLWLRLQGDDEAAREVMTALGRDAERLGDLAPDASAAPKDSLTALFSIAGRRALSLCVLLFLFQQFVGINAVLYFAPNLLTGVDFSFGSGLQTGDALPIAVVNVLMTLVALLLIDRVGRRPLLLISLAGTALGLVIIALGLGLLTAEDPAGAAVAGIGTFLFVAAFAVGLGPIAWLAAAEVSPIHVRGLAVGLIAASHWLFDALAAPISLLLTHELARTVVFVLYAGFAIAGLFLFRAIFPEQRGKSLLDIEKEAQAWAAGVRNSRFVHYTVTTLATTSGLLTGFNFAITAATLVLIAKDWSLGPFEQGALASSLVLGLAVGSFLAGSLSDRFGRRYVLMSTAVLFVAGAFGSALAPSLAWLLVARALVGLAIGITSPTTGIYVAEIAPTAIRGRLLSFEAVTYGLGAILAYCVGLVFEAVADGWRYMFAFIAIPSTVYGLALLPLPESPRWLAANGRTNAARRVMARLDEPDAERLIGDLARSKPEEDAAGGWSKLMLPEHRPILWVGLALMFLIVFCGWDMVLFYAPTVLMEIGFQSTTVSFMATLGLGVVFLLMTLVSLTVIDRIGRKPMLISGLLIMSACLAVMSGLTWASELLGGLAQWGFVATLAVFVGVFALTLGQVGEILVIEIYPQVIRGAATSLLHGMRSLFAFAFTLTFPFVIDSFGLGFTFVSYAAINLLGALYLWGSLPETKGRSLEEITRYWYDKAAGKAV
ncbi:MAG: sugar porter family MFS transporter [Kiloniellales bacterium]